MVKAPEKFVDEYLSHEKGLTGKTGKRSKKVKIRDVSSAELARLKQNLQTLWGIYRTPEIQGILSKKHNIPFLSVEGRNACLNLSYVDKGVLIVYELDTGSQKELAGARIYKQDELLINRYLTPGRGEEALLKTTDVVLQTLADVLINNNISETCIWDVIAKGDQINISVVSYF